MTLGFVFQGVATKLCFRDKSRLKWRFWWAGVCSERVEITPHVWCGANFAAANMTQAASRRRKFPIGVSLRTCPADPHFFRPATMASCEQPTTAYSLWHCACSGTVHAVASSFAFHRWFTATHRSPRVQPMRRRLTTSIWSTQCKESCQRVAYVRFLNLIRA